MFSIAFSSLFGRRGFESSFETAPTGNICRTTHHCATVSILSFDTPNAPSKRASRFTRSGNYGVTAKSRHSPGTPFSW
jgi:hypothetical protein